ncbi:hypothetical protein Sango_2470700 [Sesamum angolense]|uniref:Uncharacterized protein n=1 Tax=Sesamum angolense TaxID=2727404 RepID=A0AAE2BHY6_9LAMI|nr:hypothetical protein Sango_2470700 [Sesamum angolense]
MTGNRAFKCHWHTVTFYSRCPVDLYDATLAIGFKTGNLFQVMTDLMKRFPQVTFMLRDPICVCRFTVALQNGHVCRVQGLCFQITKVSNAANMLAVLFPGLIIKQYYPHEWKLTIDEEMSALISRNTWELVSASANADVVSCPWVFTFKYHADGSIDRCNAVCSQAGVAYISDGREECLFYGDVSEFVFMEQPLGYVAQGENPHIACKLKESD